MSFRLSRPERGESPVIVEVPHAGLRMDAASLAYCAAMGRNLGRDADLFVDELFGDAVSAGATLLCAEMSRYVCDLNRHPGDFDSQTSSTGGAEPAPHGVIWRKSTDGRPALTSTLPASEVERRLTSFYEPYHRALREEVERKKQLFGMVILLSGHSMPSFGRLGEARADIVPGTRTQTTAGRPVIAVVEQLALDFRLRLAHDDPYKGGHTTASYGKPAEGVHAIQVELARRLYMDEVHLVRAAGFADCRRFCLELVRQLGLLR